MTDNAIKNNSNAGDLDAMLKSGDAFRFISQFDKSKAYEETDENGDKKYFVELDGSSDQEDLVGDVMDLSALQEMEKTAVGTIMLRDHDPSTDKVFGHIVEAKLVQENNKVVLRLKAEVDHEDNANLRIWKSIKIGRKLGASVTVIVLAHKKNPNRKDGLIIKSVKLLEVSIVTIPCNQDSWTLAATASKALKLAENNQKSLMPVESGSDSEPEINSIEKGETEMSKTQPAEKGATETTNTLFPRTTDAVNASKELRVQVESISEANPENSKDLIAKALQSMFSSPVKVKGLFVEEQAKRQPTLWDLFDILCSVKWQLMDRKWVMEWTDLEDDYDYVGEYNVACQEFAEAAVKSFVYYGGFATDADTALDSDGDGITDEVISNALEIEKSFQSLAETFRKTTDEAAKKSLGEIGTNLLEVAAKAGIPLPVAAEAAQNESATQEPDAELVQKSTVFIEMKTRAEAAETKAAETEKTLEETQTELEIAKAALKVAVEATGSVLRQPLQQKALKV